MFTPSLVLAYWMRGSMNPSPLAPLPMRARGGGLHSTLMVRLSRCARMGGASLLRLELRGQGVGLREPDPRRERRMVTRGGCDGYTAGHAVRHLRRRGRWRGHRGAAVPARAR